MNLTSIKKQLVDAALRADSSMRSIIDSINNDLKTQSRLDQRLAQSGSYNTKNTLSEDSNTNSNEINQQFSDGTKRELPKKDLSESELRKALSYSKEKAQKTVARSVSGELFIDADLVISIIEQHLKMVKNWSSELSFRDLKNSKSLINSYTELDTYFMPRETHMHISERADKRKLVSALFEEKNHAVILGTPGAGKTTSMKKLCSIYFERCGVFPANSFPILIRCRSLDLSESKNPIHHFLIKLLPFELNLEDAINNEEESIRNDVLESLLDSLNAILIIEGLDELPNAQCKNAVLAEVRHLSSQLQSTKLLVTCRTGEFPYGIDKMNVYEVAPMTETQICEFSKKWLGDDSVIFMEQVKSSPYYDTMIRPLTLGHLCAIYERIKSIPERPKTVYRKVVNLLLEEWDQQRSINRPSKFSGFETDRQFEFLCHLAYALTSSGIRGEFSQSQIEEAYAQVYPNFGLEESEGASVVREIESLTGLFVRSGYESFEFAHKSIQEYLTAEYLVKLPSLRALGSVIDELGAELAIATSISSNPSLYFGDLVLGTFSNGRIKGHFYDSFVNRIIVERPDFFLNDEMVLAIFFILNQRIQDPNAHKSFFIIIEKLLDSNGISRLKGYYEIGKTNLHDGVIELNRIREHRIYTIPKTLKIRVMFDEIHAALF